LTYAIDIFISLKEVIAYLLSVLYLRLHISPKPTTPQIIIRKIQRNEVATFRQGASVILQVLNKCFCDLQNHFRPHGQASNIPTSYVGGPDITYRRRSLNLTVVFVVFLDSSRKNPVQYFKWGKALHYSNLLIALKRCVTANKNTATSATS